jgi:molybdate transport system substrate-binding protein
VSRKTLSFVLLIIFILLQEKALWGQTILVAAASSMRDVLEEVATEFERQSAYKVHFSFGSSGLLAHEIENKVPYDLYMPVSAEFMQELYHRKLLVPDTAKLICKGRLVVIVRKDSSAKITKLRDVANFPLVAIANPQHAPYGRVAQEALQNAGIWLAMQNRVIYTERVVDVLELVESGRVSVGLGAQSLRASAQVEYVPVEDKLYSPPEAHVAMVKGTTHREGAQAFIDFLTGDKGKAIFKGYGYLVAGEF